MAQTGTMRNNIECKPIVEQCDGCAKVVQYDDGKYCSAYPDPALKWKFGKCNFATHVKHETKKEKVVNALKASKRKAAGKM